MSSILQYGALLLPLVSFVAGNFTSPEIAFWDRPRAALIRDNVFVEGGWMQTGNWTNGEWDTKSLTTFNPTDGMLFKLSLNRSFDIAGDGTPALFETIPEYAVQNFYMDGYMFADYDELYAWGGMVLTSQDTSERTVNLPLYDAPAASNFQLGVPNLNYDPQDGTFITVTNGAGANAPSEESAFYFGGLYNANGTKYSYFSPPTDQSPWLITVQMTDLGHANWIKAQLGENITWRTEGGLVWVPTSSQGILIAIGGVVKPADVNFEVPQDNATQSMTFLKEFPVYDVGSSQWSLQPLNPSSQVPPAPLAQFCTTVASSADGSHHEIFVYGGWDSNGGSAQDDVWILSVPSFTWIKAEPSGPRKGTPRQNHVCVSPYPDQMIVIGGTGTGETPPLYNNSVDVFNLNTFNWTGTYDPTVHDVYKPNQAVLDVVSATPTASSMPTAVAGWFQNKYDMSKIRSFGPYKLESTATPTTTTTPPPTQEKHKSNRDWVIPVAVVVPVVVVGALLGVLVFLCCRKARKDRDRRAQEDGMQSEVANNRKSWIVPWIYSTSSNAPHKDIGTDSSVTEVDHGPQSPQPMTQVAHHELDAGDVSYLQGSSDTGVTRERWSQSTQVRSPRYDYAGPVEGMNTEVHEVDGSARVSGPEDINYDIRNMAMYPPSVVSGGVGTSRTVPSSSVSQSGDSITPASPQSHSVLASSGFAPIHEGEIANGDGHMSAFRAISPIDLRAERPGHERKESDISDFGTSPLPSPNPDTDDQSALPGRPRVSRSISGDDIEQHKGHSSAL